MREIVVNGRFLSRSITGVERYGLEILAHIGNKSRVERTSVNGMTGHLWEQFVLPTSLKPESILWSPANSGPLMVRNQALTIHDLSPIDHPEWFNNTFASWYRLSLPILAKQVRVIFTPSEYVKRQVKKRFGVENVVVTPNGVDTTRFCPNARHHFYELPEQFILFVGSLQPRKNLQTLLTAWGQIENEYLDVWLVIAGESRSVFKKQKLPIRKRVLFLGYVKEDDLPGLYAKATLFVLPSFEEGFGLPALEAMACGTPVIVSDGGALPEVIRDAGLIFDLSNISGLVEMIRNCLSHQEYRCTLKEKGLARAQLFSWQKTADLVWNTLHEI